MANSLTRFTVLFIAAGVCWTEYKRREHCQDVDPVNLHENLLEGKWYTARRSAETIDEQPFDCVLHQIAFSNVGHGWRFRLNTTTFAAGHLVKTELMDAEQPANLRDTSLGAFVTRTTPASGTTIPMWFSHNQPANFFFLYSDAKDTGFAVAYFCSHQQNPGRFSKEETAWILSRDIDPSPDDIDRIEGELRSRGVNLKMVDVDRSNCAGFVGEWREGTLERDERVWQLYEECVKKGKLWGKDVRECELAYERGEFDTYYDLIEQ